MRNTVVERMACLDIKAFPLQMLLRAHREWDDLPVVVVDHDTPQGVIQWANEQAYAFRILPGMRYAAGLAIARDLRGGVVHDSEIDAAMELVTRRLWRFSPRVEPSEKEPGVLWLDAAGLRHLYPCLKTWADQIRAELLDVELRSSVAVGFTRFGSYAAAKAETATVVFQSIEQERTHIHDVPMDRLSLQASFRDTLYKLGIRTLGAFVELPPSGIRKRFGAEVEALHQLAQGEGWAPLEPVPIFEPIENVIEIDYPESDLDRLLDSIAELLRPLLAELSERHEQLKTIHLSLTLDDGVKLQEELSPAAPTLDAQQILSLLRLRIETRTLSAGVVELRLHAIGLQQSHQQKELFQQAPRQNIEAAEKAFARIRAALGHDAVVVAQLHDGHLPEAQYTWEPPESLPLPQPNSVASRPLVRRLYTPPVELPPCDRQEPDGWLIAGVSEGPVEEVIGPQMITGGWWAREVSRAYHYVRTRKGRWLWIFYDRNRRRWYLHGELQ